MGTGRPPGAFAPILLSGQSRGDILTSIRASSDHAHLSQLAQECLADGLSELSRGVCWIIVPTPGPDLDHGAGGTAGEGGGSAGASAGDDVRRDAPLPWIAGTGVLLGTDAIVTNVHVISSEAMTRGAAFLFSATADVAIVVRVVKGARFEASLALPPSAWFLK